jgi:predicted Zn-dependent peptidase
MALYVRVGSRFEDRANNGLSHFLEHMLYRGTKRLPSAHAVNFAFERLGGYLYAATHTDFGVFSITMPPESLDEASALFGEVLRSPEFFDIEVEQGIVCEEILEDLDDDGRQVNADNLSRSLIYPSHPLGFTITGDQKQVRSFDRAALSMHHQRHYTAAASVLAFGGAIASDQALSLAERDFGRFSKGTPVAATAPTHTQKKARLKIVENASSQTDLRVSFRALPEVSEERPILDMLMRLLDDGMSTRLYHRICDQKGLCYDVSASFDGYEDDGVVDFAAGVQHARASTVVREILGLLEDLGKTGPREDELEKAHRRHRWELEAMNDSGEDLAGFYAGGILFDRFESVEERLAASERVTAEQVRTMARFLGQPDRLNVIAVGLLEDDEDKRLSEVVKTWKGVQG